MNFEQKLYPELRTALAAMPSLGNLTADVARARVAIGGYDTDVCSLSRGQKTGIAQAHTQPVLVLAQNLQQLISSKRRFSLLVVARIVCVLSFAR